MNKTHYIRSVGFIDFFFLPQIRHFRQQEGSNSHAVQQGEVSSSNPNILSNDQVGPILLEVCIIHPN